jgi:hypothetical protein
MKTVVIQTKTIRDWASFHEVFAEVFTRKSGRAGLLVVERNEQVLHVARSALLPCVLRVASSGQALVGILSEGAQRYSNVVLSLSALPVVAPTLLVGPSMVLDHVDERSNQSRSGR